MKIMVAYDGSDASKHALSLAKIHARTFRGAIVIIATSWHGNIKDQLSSLEEIEQEHRRFRTELEDDQIHCFTEVLSQDTTAGEALIDFAGKIQVDEIIIGIQKTSKVGKLLFGSTAQYVILNSDCPVVTLH